MRLLRSNSARYGLAAVAALLASLLYLVHGPVELDSDLHYFGFVLAVLVAALWGGLGPGLLATGLCAFVSAYFLLPPTFSISIASHGHLARLVLFVGEGMLLSVVGRTLHEADAADVALEWPLRYLPVFLFVGTATGLKMLAFRDLEHSLPFTFFFVAIAASAWIGGFGPGLAATMLSTFVATYFFLLPQSVGSVVTAVNAERIGLFILEGCLISGLGAIYPRSGRLARRALEQMHQYAEQASKRLEDLRAFRLTSKGIVWEWDLISDRVTYGGTQSERPEAPVATTSLKSWLDQIHPKERAAVVASLESALKTGREMWACDYRRLRPGGRYALISDRACIIRNASGSPLRIVGRSTDVKALERLSRLRRKHESKEPVLLDRPLAILLADEGFRIKHVNQGSCDVLKYRDVQFEEMRVEELFQPARRAVLTQLLFNLDCQARDSKTFEESCLRAGGEPFPARINVSKIVDRNDQSMYWVMVIEDLSQ